VPPMAPVLAPNRPLLRYGSFQFLWYTAAEFFDRRRDEPRVRRSLRHHGGRRFRPATTIRRRSNRSKGCRRTSFQNLARADLPASNACRSGACSIRRGATPMIIVNGFAAPYWGEFARLSNTSGGQKWLSPRLGRYAKWRRQQPPTHLCFTPVCFSPGLKKTASVTVAARSSRHENGITSTHHHHRVSESPRTPLGGELRATSQQKKTVLSLAASAMAPVGTLSLSSRTAASRWRSLAFYWEPFGGYHGETGLGHFARSSLRTSAKPPDATW